MKYYFIVNPGSRTGKGQALWDELENKLKKSKLEYEVFYTKGAGEATRYAETICREHPEMKRIVIAGGDGTANEAVNGLSGYSHIIMGYIPTGSSNDLARGLKISPDPAKALNRTISPVEFKKIDHGFVEYLDGCEDGVISQHAGEDLQKADWRKEEDADEPAVGRKFAVSSGVGYDADICYEAENSKLKSFLNRLHIGKLIYYIMGIKLIFTNKRAKATIIIDGKRRLKYDGLLYASAMNTLYEGGGMPMGPDADPTDGKITMCIVHDISRLKHIRLMPSVIKAKHINHKGVEQITCRTCEIILERPLMVHTDGELAGRHSHIRYSCLPDQIRMML